MADIGASWYARLEAGHVANPSLNTMRGIARALALTSVERDFAFELAGVFEREKGREADMSSANAISEMLNGSGVVAMSLWDRYLAPQGWNATADGMFGFSRYPDSLERNPIVRMSDDSIVRFFGDGYDEWARNIVGMFRRAYSTGSPTAYAQTVYDLARRSADFCKYWDAHHVAETSTPQGETIVRHHPVVGTFSATPVDLVMPDRQLILRILAPYDDEARSKFEQLRSLGRAFNAEIDLR